MRGRRARRVRAAVPRCSRVAGDEFGRSTCYGRGDWAEPARSGRGRSPGRCAVANRAAISARPRGVRRGRLRCAPRRARRAKPLVGWAGSGGSPPPARHNRVGRRAACGRVRSAEPSSGRRSSLGIHPSCARPPSVDSNGASGQTAPAFWKARASIGLCASSVAWSCSAARARAPRRSSRCQPWGGVRTRTCRSQSSPARAAPSAGVSSQTVRSRVSNVKVAVAGELHPVLAH